MQVSELLQQPVGTVADPLDRSVVFINVEDVILIAASLTLDSRVFTVLLGRPVKGTWVCINRVFKNLSSVADFSSIVIGA